MTSSRLLLSAAAIVLIAGCGTVPLGQKIETQPPAEVRSGAPVIIGAHEAARIDMANSGTFRRRGPKEPTQRAPQVVMGGEIAVSRQDIDELISSLDQQAGADPAPTVHSSSLDSQPGHTDLWERIRSGFGMPELNSSLVAKKQRQYLAQPAYMQRMFKRAERYMFHIVEEIERRGMPTEIALLPFVESAMNPVAMSHAKASGLWQFIPSTGRAYDLKQNWWVDNRRDVVESTRAALDYLQMLHQMHDGDWFLALASYNWGEGSVNRAIRRNKSRGRPTNYTSLRMPRETRHYVPKLMALKSIVLNARALRVALPELPNEPYFVVLEKTRPIDLKLAAKFAGMSVKDFIALNPAHNRPVISASRNNMIKLPANRLEPFLEALEDHQAAKKSFVSWRPYTLKKGETVKTVARRTGTTSRELLKANGLSSRQRIIAGTRILVPSSKATDAHIAQFDGPKVVEVIVRPAAYHRVRKRDNLTRIARRWGVSKRTLRRWNGLRNDRLKRGQKLLVRQPVNQTVMTTAHGKRQVIARHMTKTVAYQPGNSHRVRRGDNLGSIARRHGVTVSQIQHWNGLSGSRIRAGQTLVVSAAKTTIQKTAAPRRTTGKRYTVRRGDNLGLIARRHGVAVSKLKSWNGLRRSIIRPGQKLVVSAAAPTRTASKGTAASKRTTANRKASAHKVARGDTLIGIARRYGTSVASLRQVNGLKSDRIRLGQRLRLQASAKAVAPRPSTVKHRVRRGDTLIGIARRYGVSVAELRSWNAIKGDNIRLGQRLKIQAVESAGTQKTSGKRKVS
jgi:membrane-bound lytic murein transglycosylase D